MLFASDLLRKRLRRCFRVVLTRPYVHVPWGYEWNDEFFADTGGRVIRAVREPSPLATWNARSLI